MIFNKKTFGLGFLKYPSSLSNNDSIGLVEDIESIVSPMYTSTSLSTSILESTGSQSSLTKTITSTYHSSNGNGNSPTPCLPWWDIKIVEATSVDVFDISMGQ